MDRQTDPSGDRDDCATDNPRSKYPSPLNAQPDLDFDILQELDVLDQSVNCTQCGFELLCPAQPSPL